MRSTFSKLAGLAIIIGLGLFMIFQAQSRLFQRPEADSADEVTPAPVADLGSGGEEMLPPGQWEPDEMPPAAEPIEESDLEAPFAADNVRTADAAPAMNGLDFRDGPRPAAAADNIRLVGNEDPFGGDDLFGDPAPTGDKPVATAPEPFGDDTPAADAMPADDADPFGATADDSTKSPAADPFGDEFPSLDGPAEKPAAPAAADATAAGKPANAASPATADPASADPFADDFPAATPTANADKKPAAVKPADAATATPAALPDFPDPFGDAPGEKKPAAPAEKPAELPGLRDPFGASEPGVAADGTPADKPSATPLNERSIPSDLGPVPTLSDDPFGTAAPAPVERKPQPTPAAPTLGDDPFGSEPTSEKKPAQPSLPVTDDPFGGDPAPALNTPAKPADDDFPALEPMSEKKPADDPFPALNVGEPNVGEPMEDAPADTPAVEENPFPALPGEFPGSVPEKTTTAEPAPALELPAADPLASEPQPSQPLPSNPPTLDLPDEPAGAPRELDLTGNETVPSLEELKGDGVLTPNAPRGKQLPQLEILKEAPQSAILNQPFVYSIVIRNVGSVAAEEVTVQDRIPKGSNLTGTIPRAELVGRRLVWKLGTLAPGKEQKIAVRVVPVEPGPIGSVATVNFVAAVGAETLITKPQVSLNIEAPTDAKVGDLIPYKFVMQNKGRQPLTGVVLRDLIPAELHHPAGRDLENPIGDLAPGAKLEVVLELKAAQPGTPVNTAILTADGGLELEASAAVKVRGDNLQVSRTGPQQRLLNRVAVYVNDVKNVSDKTIAGAVLVEKLPAGMEFSSATDGGQYRPDERAIYWSLPPLEPGHVFKVQSKLVAREAGEQQSVVAVQEPRGGEIETVSHTVVEDYAALGIALTEFDQPVLVGDKVVVRIEASNNGTASAENVQLKAQLPIGLRLDAVRGKTRYRVDGQQVTFEPLTSLQAGKTEIIELEMQAVQASKARVDVSIQSNRMSRAVSRQTSIIVFQPRGGVN